MFAVDPAVLPAGGFHTIPVRRHDQNHDFCASLQRFHIGSAVKRSGFQFAARSLYHALRLVAQGIETLVHGLSRGLRRRKSKGLIRFTIAFQRLPG